MFENDNITLVEPQPLLKPCPHCGGKGKFKGTSVYACPGVVIVCTQCGVRTPSVHATHYIFYRGKQDVTLTIEQAVEEVRAAWNARIQTINCVIDPEGGATNG
jgi:Lar family restriction alleviation protein